MLVTGLPGVAVLFRATARGGFARPETAVDAGLACVSVGALAPLLYHPDTIFWFSSPTLLTAVHIHCVGFVLSVLTGLTGHNGHPDPRL